jgi:glutathione S-transferase
VRKVRVVAHELSLPLVLTRADAHQIPSTFGAINPINRIPALRLYDLGTLTIGCALGYLDFRFGSEDWRGRYRALARWYEEIALRVSMRATVPTLTDGWGPP